MPSLLEPVPTQEILHMASQQSRKSETDIHDKLNNNKYANRGFPFLDKIVKGRYNKYVITTMST